MSCTATSVYLKQLEIEGYKYKPDLIILGFFVGNDFTEDYVNKQTVKKFKKINSNKFVELLYNSRLLAILGNSLKTNLFSSYKNSQYAKYLGKILEERSKDYNFSPSYKPFEERLPKDKFLEVETNRLTILTPNSPDYANLKLIEENLLKIKNLAKIIDANC